MRARSSATVVRPVGDLLVYRRVSTDDQAEEHRSSPREQLRAAEEHAKGKLGKSIDPALIFDDLGVSGATAEGRPGFMELVGYCEKHPRPRRTQGTILVLNDSRFGRFDNPEEATYWRVHLFKLGWIVRFCEGDDIPDGVARGVLRFIGSAQASEYRANLKRTARRATRATAEEGRWQNRAPMGFRRLATRLDGSTRVLEATQRKSDDETVRLTLGPRAEIDVVRYCFEAYAVGSVTIGGLSRELDARWPARRWSPNTVGALLKNPAYQGDVVWCRRPHDAVERAEAWIRSPDQWVTVRDAHPAIVSRDLFARVQQRLAGNKKATRATAGGYPLSGLIGCAVCRSPFIGGGGRVGPANDPDRWRQYLESAASRPVQYHKNCPGPIRSLNKRWLETTVLDEIAKVASDPRVHEVIAEEVDVALAALRSDSTDESGALRAEKEQLTQKRKRLVDAIAAGTVTEREAARSMQEVRDRLATIETELERAQFSSRRLDGSVGLRDRVLALATDFKAIAAKATGPQLREMVAQWLAGASYDKRTNRLQLRIRMVPDILGADGGVFGSRIRRARDARNQNSRRERVIVRTIEVPRRKSA